MTENPDAPVCVVGWNVDDVRALDNCPQIWTDEDCKSFLQSIDRVFTERLIEEGWVILTGLLEHHLREKSEKSLEIDRDTIQEILNGERKILFISPEKAMDIIETRRPLGEFVVKNCSGQQGKAFVAIDNSTGDAWAEEFDELKYCIGWLCNKKAMLERNQARARKRIYDKVADVKNACRQQTVNREQIQEVR